MYALSRVLFALLAGTVIRARQGPQSQFEPRLARRFVKIGVVAWAYASNVYTQSGTDADPGALDSQTGVQNAFYGLQEALIVPGGRRLVINGDLTVDPERFLLIVGDKRPVTQEVTNLKVRIGLYRQLAQLAEEQNDG